MFKRFAVTVLTVSLMFCMFCSPALAAAKDARVTIGADNSDEAIETVYDFFRLDRGDVKEITVTNEQERAALEGLVPDEQIGDVALSCAYVQPRSSGGIELENYNIKYVTEEMFRAALQTAGIKNAKVVVAAAHPVSGTGALTGIYRAYEDATGQKLDADAKSVAVEELVVTGDLQEAIGGVSSEIIQELKKKLAQTKNMTDAEVRELIRDTAEEYGAELSSDWVEQILGLIKKMNDLNVDPDTFLKVVQAGGSFQDFLSGVGDFFKDVGGFLSGLFAGAGEN